MKKLILFVFVSSVAFAQIEEPKSIVQLQYEVTQITDTWNPASGIQYQESVLPTTASKKNPGLAILFSMILPGMGELYAGDYSSGKYFTIADGVLWGVFAGFTSYGNWKEDNYKAFAQSKAGVDISGKEDDYFANLGTYMNVDDYNKEQEFNRDFVKTYNGPSFYWKWQNDNDRKEYRSMWTSSEAAYTNVRFAVGALVLNRLISAINAVRIVSAHNKSINEQNEIGYYFSYKQSATLPSSINFNLIKAF